MYGASLFTSSAVRESPFIIQQTGLIFFVEGIGVLVTFFSGALVDERASHASANAASDAHAHRRNRQ